MQRLLLVHREDWLGVSRLPRLVHDAGIATTLLAREGALVTQTRYVDERVVLPDDDDAFVTALRTRLEHEPERYAFTLLADDAILELVARHAGEAWLDHCFPVDHRGPALDLVRSKCDFLRAARAAGLPTPRGAVVRSAREAHDAAAEIGFPVMVKRDVGSGGSGVRRANDRRDLAGILATLHDAAFEIEEYIDGIVCGCEALFDRGRPVAWQGHEKPYRYPTAFGPSTIRRAFAAPALDALVHDVGALLGFHGFVAICFMWEPVRQRLTMLEVNPRPGSGMHVRPEPARIFGSALRAMLEGTSAAHTFRPQRSGEITHLFPQDLQRALRARDLAGVLRWLPPLTSARDLALDDPQLLLAQLRRVAYETAPETTARVATFRRVARSS